MCPPDVLGSCAPCPERHWHGGKKNAPGSYDLWRRDADVTRLLHEGTRGSFHELHGMRNGKLAFLPTRGENILIPYPSF